MLIIALLLFADPQPATEAQWSLNLDARFDYRTGKGDPQYGYGFGLGGRRLETRMGGVGLWGGLDFYYDQFISGVHVMAVGANGQPLNYDDELRLTHASFLPMELLRVDLDRITLEVGAGAGLGIVHFFRPFDGMNPTVDHTDTALAVRGAASAGYQFWRDTSVELRFAYTYTFLSTPASSPDLNALFSIGLGAVYRF